MPTQPPKEEKSRFENTSPEETLQQLQTNQDQGLTQNEAQKRLEKYGPNELAEERMHPLLKFLSYFWGPIPWMIEVAAVLSAVLQHRIDLGIIGGLLLFNAAVGFWQEYQAASALEALKKQLALRARVRRAGQWREIAARELVPGDILRVRLGASSPPTSSFSTATTSAWTNPP
jgi:H+-transporting ATPase